MAHNYISPIIIFVVGGLILALLTSAQARNSLGELFGGGWRIVRHLWKALRWSRLIPEQRRLRNMGKDYIKAFPAGDPYSEIRKRYFSEVSRWIDAQLERKSVAERIVFIRDILDREHYAVPLLNQAQERDRTNTIDKLRSELKKNKKIRRL